MNKCCVTRTILCGAATGALIGAAATVAVHRLKLCKKSSIKKAARCKLDELDRLIDTADKFVRDL